MYNLRIFDVLFSGRVHVGRDEPYIIKRSKAFETLIRNKGQRKERKGRQMYVYVCMYVFKACIHQFNNKTR